MYTQFFRLTQAPFSISPDPRYLFMSDRHREALAHLLYGVNSGGGVVVLTGDIGTGKTTICRCFLEQVPSNCNVAYIFNPRLTANELLQTVCEEFHVETGAAAEDRSSKRYIDALNQFLLSAHAEGRNNVLIIDEAQNLAPRVLEQLRLLTNLETNERKLLQIILIGQPELRTMLSQPELEQLAQRVVANYHLSALSEADTANYIQHRLSTAGLAGPSPFPTALVRQIHRLSGGVPRRINLLCDRALLGAYASGLPAVDRRILDGAARELFVKGRLREPESRHRPVRAAAAVLAVVAAAGAIGWGVSDGTWLPAWRAAGNTHSASAPLAAGDNDPGSLLPAVESGTALQASAGEHPVDSESDAIRLLARLWGSTLPEDDPCGAASEHGLRCHRSSGGIAELRRLDRPAVLQLRDDAGDSYAALLTRLDEAHATLQFGTERKLLPVVAVARRFDGEFVTLWRSPPGFDVVLKLEDRGQAVDWLATRLAALGGVEPPPPGTPFDQKLRRQVLQLQQSYGLATDGIVGAVTAMQLNRATGVAEPRLLGSAHEAPPAPE